MITLDEVLLNSGYMFLCCLGCANEQVQYNNLGEASLAQAILDTHDCTREFPNGPEGNEQARRVWKVTSAVS